MKSVKEYLDSTYLKTPEQSGLSEAETLRNVMSLTDEAIEKGFFAVMIRPEYVKKVKEYITEQSSKVKVGTVIDFPKGISSEQEKVKEAEKAIEDGADELDFVINYNAFIDNKISIVRNEFIAGTKLALSNNKIVKWIIEIAALTDIQIADITKCISTWTEENFPEYVDKVFVKSSTGFFKTPEGKPNGATVEGISIMLKNAGKLPVKAAGGVRTPKEAVEMIEMGVKRIGTSSASSLVDEK